MAKNVEKAAMADANQAQGTATSLGNTLIPSYQSLLTGQGPQAAAITAATQGPLAASYDALKQSAMSTAARTRNDAATPALLAQLARSKGSQQAQLSADNTMKEIGMGQSGLANMYGINAKLPAEYFNAASNAQNATTSEITGVGNMIGKFV